MKTQLTTKIVYITAAGVLALAVSWQPSSFESQKNSGLPERRLAETDVWGTVIDGRAVIPVGIVLVKLDRGDVVPVPARHALIPGERVNLQHYIQPN